MCQYLTVLEESRQMPANHSRVFALMLGFAVSIAISGSVAAEPVELDIPALDNIAAGSSGFPDRRAIMPRIERMQQVSTYITMPIANATAICIFCSPGASANANSLAIGNAQADSVATAFGTAQSDVSTSAIGLSQIPQDILAALRAYGAYR